ncbi:uncharacterized protein LOC123542422 [Mercenaria mercenaria]|uniref:uncharacterized protein LOC123542422 n=1 Tax=Mercenaria mercenaria TaxID=6596 RepID=UPI00234E4767|nr:uncharacterized protein LOC123542422 [Mercenaria mercenaria]
MVISKDKLQRLQLVVPVVTLVLFLFCNIKATSGLTCLECADVPSARDCDQVKECGSHEVCYSTQIVSTSGHIYREMGCRDKMQCSSGIVGKRSSFRRAGDLPVCDGCCDSLWCQANLCQDKDYTQNRGPICYECEDQLKDENCTKIKECSRDEVCVETFKQSPSFTLLRQTGCFGKHVCDTVFTASNFHPTDKTCFNCCSGDLCNTRCDLQQKPATGSVSVAPTTAGTTAACVDSTAEATCKLASSIVCQDQTHAQNANCEHYCGYC